jgi:hypothetical protein
MLFTLIVTIVIGYILIASFSGCTNRRTTVETTREVESTQADRARYNADRDDGRVVERTETTTVEKHDSSDGGLFSIIGDIIALPFRAVGALFSAIF